MNEPANDLAIAVAIASSYYEQPIARDIVCIGEIGNFSGQNRFETVDCICFTSERPCSFTKLPSYCAERRAISQSNPRNKYSLCTVRRALC